MWFICVYIDTSTYTQPSHFLSFLCWVTDQGRDNAQPDKLLVLTPVTFGQACVKGQKKSSVMKGVTCPGLTGCRGAPPSQIGGCQGPQRRGSRITFDMGSAQDSHLPRGFLLQGPLPSGLSWKSMPVTSMKPPPASTWPGFTAWSVLPPFTSVSGRRGVEGVWGKAVRRWITVAERV